MYRSVLKSYLFVSRQFVSNGPVLKTVNPLTSSIGIIVRMTTSVDPSKLKVVHDAESMEFYIQLADGEDNKAVLQYRYINPSHVDLQHTVVPTEYRKHGVAKLLAQAAFDHFVSKGTNIRPTCTYLQKFYKDNPLPQYKAKIKWM